MYPFFYTVALWLDTQSETALFILGAQICKDDYRQWVTVRSPSYYVGFPVTKLITVWALRSLK